MQGALESQEQELDRIGAQLEAQLEALDRLRLQAMSQQFQQSYQVISNLMKVQHDTLKGIINNLKA